MSISGYDPGDRNNWYQSPQLGLSPEGYGGGISGGYYSTPYHPYGSSTCAFTQFSSQPNPYPPLQLNPSATIISGHLFPHQFPCVAQQPLTTTPRDPYIPTYHSPHSDPNPWIYPSISQRHSYDLSVTSVHSPFIFTKIMTTPLIYHSAPSIPTFQSPLVPTFVPQLPITDLKPLSLNHKSFRRFRHRVAMAAKARVAKKTRNSYMLHGVGKYSRSKMYHKRSLFPRHNSKMAVEIMEELGQLGVGRKTLINTSEPPAVQFGTLPTTGNTSSFSFPVTEPTDHSAPIQASAASSLPPSIDLQESIVPQLTGFHLEQAGKWPETYEIEQHESIISVSAIENARTECPTPILEAENSSKIPSPIEVVQIVAQRRTPNSAIEADKQACDHHPLEKNCDDSGGLRTLDIQFEVIASSFDTRHLFRALSTLLLKNRAHYNCLSKAVSYHLSRDVLEHDSAFNIVGYNPFVNLECGPANSAWLENFQRSAVLPQVAQLKLPRNKLESLYEQMVLEMIELRDIETARSILRNTQVTGVLKQEQPEGYLQLQHLHAGTYFDPNEAYPDSTKEKRHAQIARALAAVIVVPPSRLMILICQALEWQQHRGFYPPGTQSDLFRGMAAMKQDVDDLYRTTLRHTSKFRTKSHAKCARFSPDGQFLVATMRMKDVTGGNLYLIEVVVLYLPCQTKAICQPRRFSVDEVIDFVKSNSELSFLWYYCDPLLSRDYGVFLMTNINKSFQYVVRHVHKDMLFLATSSSIFYSPFHALVRKLFTSSPMAAIHLLRPPLAKILREDEHYFIGMVVLISINQLVSLKSKKQGLEIMYGDVYNGNYCSHVSCSLYFLDFMITWFIELGFVAIVSGDLALVPQNFFSVPTQSNEAPLLILLTVIMHSQIMEIVISSHLLHCPNREALRVCSNIQNLYHWQSNSNSHVSVHLCALIHTWQVTTEDGIAFGAALTNIKDLNMIYPTLWYVPLFTCDNPNVVLWSRYLQFDYKLGYALKLLKTAIEKAGYTGKVVIERDVAASEFYGTDKTYDLTFKEEKTYGSRKISGNALEDVYKSFVTEYPIVSIEDFVDQDDWEPYSKMTAEMGEKVQNFKGDTVVYSDMHDLEASLGLDVSSISFHQWGITFFIFYFEDGYEVPKFWFEISAIYLVTMKPVICVTNVAESDIAEPGENPHVKEVMSPAFELQSRLVKMSAQVQLLLASNSPDLKGTRESLVLISKKQEWKQLFSGHSINYLKVVASVVIRFTVSVTWHLIKGVKEDLKTEIIAAFFKDVEGLSLTPIASVSSYFYGKTTVLMTTSEDKIQHVRS